VGRTVKVKMNLKEKGWVGVQSAALRAAVNVRNRMVKEREGVVPESGSECEK
jgi:hypothetical protein